MLRIPKNLLSQLTRLMALWCLCWSLSASADWVQVTGSSVVSEGLYDQARIDARDDALRQAVMQFGAQVSSRQHMEQGVLKRDSVTLSSQARVKRAKVVDEYMAQERLHLVLNVEIDQVAQCPDSQASGYKKAVAVLGFALQTPKQGSLGGLEQVERGLSQALSAALQRQNGLLVYSHSDVSLHADSVNAPSVYTAENQLSHAADFAQQLGAQFVLSGVVRDISVQDPEAFGSSRWQSLLRLGKLNNQQRNFAVELFVHDGFSGSLVWQKSFSRQAEWSADRHHSVGFGSAEFWQNAYGRAVAATVSDMAFQVDEQLRCQPFMTRISRVDGKTLHFASGASTGIRPGDTFSLYRSFNFYDANRLSGIELSNIKTALTVSQVHPQFGSGTLSVDPGRLNIQQDDVLIAW